MEVAARTGKQARADTLRVASVPAGHVYVRHLSAMEAGGGVVRLPDPRPLHGTATPGQWWPPAMLDPDWVDAHAAEFDVFHIHFGFDALSAAQLSRLVDALDRNRKPLVYTVHDLRNPHHPRPEAHDAHLDVLIPRAAELITLTPGAAAVIAGRWGRTARVLPHPHVVDFDRMASTPPRHTDAFRVGVHAKSVRASMDPAAVVAALLPLTAELPGLRLIVNVHRDVADDNGHRHDPALMSLLRSAESSGDIALNVHDCFTDDELWDYLQSLDLSVLPYKFGTHSGWLEACHDLGTAVLAPSCGFFAEQRPCLTYRQDDEGLDGESLRAAVRTAYESRPAWRADLADRAAERAWLASAHRETYEAAAR
jgi:hypothetical protein